MCPVPFKRKRQKKKSDGRAGRLTDSRLGRESKIYIKIALVVQKKAKQKTKTNVLPLSATWKLLQSVQMFSTLLRGNHLSGSVGFKHARLAGWLAHWLTQLIQVNLYLTTKARIQRFWSQCQDKLISNKSPKFGKVKHNWKQRCWNRPFAVCKQVFFIYGIFLLLWSAK